MRLIRQAGLLWAGTIMLLAVATMFVFTDLRRYNGADLPFAYDPGFMRVGPGGWQVEGDAAGVSVESGTLRLRNGTPGATLTLRQVWPLPPGAPRAFRVAATIATRAVSGGPAVVAFVADTDTRPGQPSTAHRLAVLRGSQGPDRYVDRFEFPRSAREAELVIRLLHATGEVAVRGLEIRALEERALVGAARAGLQAAWGVALLAGCWLFWRGVDDRRAAVALLGAGGAGLVLLLLPQTGRNAVIDPLASRLPEGLLDSEAVGDLGHVVIFALLGLLVRLSHRREPAWRQVLLLVALAGIAELLQFLTELRSPDWGDWATNAVGALAGWLPVAVWLRLRERPLAAQRCSSTTLPPQAAKQRRWSASQVSSSVVAQERRSQKRRVQ